MYDDFTSGEGFIRDSAGEWILPNCIGASIVVLVPIIAVFISFARDRLQEQSQEQLEDCSSVQGRFGGVAALIIAVVSTVLIAVLFRWAVQGRAEKMLLWLSLPPAIVALFVSNYLVDIDKGSTVRASWFARWAGMLSTADIGGFIALSLIYSTAQQEAAESVSHSQEQLSGVSYLILSVVFLLIIGGLGWCFYRALSKTNQDIGVQYPDEVGDEG